MFIIPTASREKLPAGFTYPLGAELISAALKDIAFLPEMQLDFSWRDIFWKAKYQAKLDSKGVIVVLEVKFSDRWRISICAVPSAYSAVARTQLASALPILATVLCETPVSPAHFEWLAAFDLSSQSVQTSPSYLRPIEKVKNQKKYRGSIR